MDGWTARFAAGVTHRANSVWPRTPPTDLSGSIQRVEPLYAERGIQPAFQISDSTPGASELEAALFERDYHAVDATDTLVAASALVAESAVTGDAFEAGTGADAGPGPSPSPGPRVRIHDVLTPEWVANWWTFEGRDPKDAHGKRVVAQIMSGVPALYAEADDNGGVASVARLALVGGRDALERRGALDGWGGLYAVATRPNARRRGLGRAVVAALAQAAVERGIPNLWLQVLADNEAALALYGQMGFTRGDGYRYVVR